MEEENQSPTSESTEQDQAPGETEQAQTGDEEAQTEAPSDLSETVEVPADDLFMTSGELSAVYIIAIAGIIIVAALMAMFYLGRRRKEMADLTTFSDGDESPSTGVSAAADEEEVEFDQEDGKTDQSQVKKKPKLRVKEVEEIRELDKQTWLSKLKDGLSKTRISLAGNLSQVFGRGAKIDDALLEKIHEVLYRADIGVETSDKLVKILGEKYQGSSDLVSWDQVKKDLATSISGILGRNTKPLNQPSAPPYVILVVGVNGVGKTTTIGKLAAHFLAQNKKVLLAAADTYRAAAIEQLDAWGKRLGVEVIKQQQGSDPAAVAFDAVKAAKARGAEILMIDTAGRLHNKAELMDELGKVKRVIGKDLEGAPHEVWLVIDATTGQNALMQVKHFSEVVDVSGLIVTKLDGTAKGGVIISVSDRFDVPIRFIGIGEKASDLREFSASDFAESLF
jgi:fused signal recognition particle receptor